MKNILILIAFCLISNFATAQTKDTKLNYFEAEGNNYYILNGLDNKTDYKIYNQKGGGKVVANYVSNIFNHTSFKFNKSTMVGFVLLCKSGMVYHLQPKLFEFDQLKIVNDGSSIEWMGCQNINQDYSYIVQGTNNGIDFIDITTIENKSASYKQKFEVSIIQNVFEKYRVAIIDNKSYAKIVYQSSLIENPFIGLVYPTKVSNSFHALAYKNNLVLQVFNITGNILQTKSLIKGDNMLEFENYSSGIYFVKIKSEKEVNSTLSDS
jgi:Secretion system C-terminal sorting domain